MIIIRRIQIGKADLFKQLRLTSLQDAPFAFSSTYESALQRSEKSWLDQANSTAQGNDRATFIAFSDETPIGIAALYRLQGQADVGEVLQVWVASEHRGTSVPWDLMNAVFNWAGNNNFRKIIATVTKGNTRALKFYSKYGFTLTDEIPLRDSDDVIMAREVESG